MNLTDEQRGALHAVAGSLPVKGAETARRMARLLDELEQGQDPTDTELVKEIVTAALEAGVPGRVARVLITILDEDAA